MSNPQYYLRLRSLPKPEYRLMKRMVEQYKLKDESELFAIALRLLYEVGQYQPLEQTGYKWIVQVIDSYRSLKEEDRVYDL